MPMNLRARSLSLVLLPLLLIGCAQVPKEAVHLSDLVGKDLAATRTAHTALVRNYYAFMRQDINEFVDLTYRPYILRKTIDDLDLVDMISAAARGEGESGLDVLDIMEIYVEQAIRQIERFRAEMVGPIDDAEAQLLADLDRSYTAMINANATVTAHLRSITDVHREQQEALSHLGVDEGLRDRIAEQAARLSGQLDQLLDKAREIDQDMGREDVFSRLPESVERLTASRDREDQ